MAKTFDTVLYFLIYPRPQLWIFRIFQPLIITSSFDHSFCSLKLLFDFYTGTFGPKWVRAVLVIYVEQWPSFRNKMPKKMLHLVTQIPDLNYLLMWNLRLFSIFLFGKEVIFHLDKRMKLSSFS